MIKRLRIVGEGGVRRRGPLVIARQAYQSTYESEQNPYDDKANGLVNSKRTTKLLAEHDVEDVDDHEEEQPVAEVVKYNSGNTKACVGVHGACMAFLQYGGDKAQGISTKGDC